MARYGSRRERMTRANEARHPRASPAPSPSAFFSGGANLLLAARWWPHPRACSPPNLIPCVPAGPPVAASPRDLARTRLTEAEAIVEKAGALSREALAANRSDALEAATEAVRHAVFAIQDAERASMDLAEPTKRAEAATCAAMLALERAIRLLAK